MLLEKIDELLKEVSTLTAQNAEEVEQLRIKYLSKKGEINALMADFRTVPADQKKEVGVKINELKNAALEKINGLKEQMEEAEASSDDIDLTRTAYPVALGTRHPLTVVKNQIIDIFASWVVGSKVEHRKYVLVVIYLRTLEKGKAHASENVDNLILHYGEWMAGTECYRVGGTGQVDIIA
jgi:phenylalanyl-tRNA synthetase alpha subunit